MALSQRVDRVQGSDLPINADFENGSACDSAGVEANLHARVATGVAELSIEVSTSDAATPLFTLDDTVARIRAARRAIDTRAGDKLLARRISIGGAMAHAAWGGSLRSAPSLAQDGCFDGSQAAASGKDLNVFFVAAVVKQAGPQRLLSEPDQAGVNLNTATDCASCSACWARLCAAAADSSTSAAFCWVT